MSQTDLALWEGVPSSRIYISTWVRNGGFKRQFLPLNRIILNCVWLPTLSACVAYPNVLMESRVSRRWVFWKSLPALRIALASSCDLDWQNENRSTVPAVHKTLIALAEVACPSWFAILRWQNCCLYLLKQCRKKASMEDCFDGWAKRCGHWLQ